MIARTSFKPELDELFPKIGPPSNANVPSTILEVLQRYRPRGNPGILSLIPAPAEKYQFKVLLIKSYEELYDQDIEISNSEDNIELEE